MTDPGATVAILEVEHVTMEFPGVRALDDVHFDVHAGEVHALVGENGAGKSTLLKVLGGVYTPTRGRLRLAGAEYVPVSPSDAIRAGIAVIYQEFTLFPDLTVAENVYIGREPISRVSRGHPVRRDPRHAAASCSRLLGVDIDPDARVADIGVAAQQLVEIARALSQKAASSSWTSPPRRSTAPRSPGSDVIRRLRDEGRAVIYVSHHLEEVFEVADRATVLRDGRNVATLGIADATRRARAPHGRPRRLVGRAIATRSRSRRRRAPAHGPLGRARCCARWTSRSGGARSSGIGGVAGAGQSDLTQVDLRCAARSVAGPWSSGARPSPRHTRAMPSTRASASSTRTASEPASCPTCRSSRT